MKESHRRVLIRIAGKTYVCIMMFVAPSGRHIGMLEVEGKEGREGGGQEQERERKRKRERGSKKTAALTPF